MTTFVIRSGFPPAYVLSMDLPGFNALYSSAVRGHYHGRIEDMAAIRAAASEGFNGAPKGKKGALSACLDYWKHLVRRQGDPEGGGGDDGRAGVKELAHDVKTGFRSLLQGTGERGTKGSHGRR
jgi:hypothetical protein